MAWRDCFGNVPPKRRKHRRQTEGREQEHYWALSCPKYPSVEWGGIEKERERDTFSLGGEDGRVDTSTAWLKMDFGHCCCTWHGLAKRKIRSSSFHYLQ